MFLKCLNVIGYLFWEKNNAVKSWMSSTFSRLLLSTRNLSSSGNFEEIRMRQKMLGSFLSYSGKCSHMETNLKCLKIKIFCPSAPTIVLLRESLPKWISQSSGNGFSKIFLANTLFTHLKASRLNSKQVEPRQLEQNQLKPSQIDSQHLESPQPETIDCIYNIGCIVRFFIYSFIKRVSAFHQFTQSKYIH